MNKFMAILFLLGAIGGFGLSQQRSFEAQDQTRLRTPVGEPRTVYISRHSRLTYIAFGSVCTAGCLYFLFRMRRDDLRK